MKKIITTVLLAALLLSLFSMAAFAADAPTDGGIYDVKVDAAFSATATVEALDETGTAVTKSSAAIDGSTVDFYAKAVQLKVTLSGVTAGDYYLILAQNATGVPTEDNIVYIDQVTAEGTSVTFKVYPGKLEAGTTYYVYRSSNKETSALVLSFKYYVAYMKGDVYVDEMIDTTDALYVLLACVDKFPDITPNQELAADVDEDGFITTTDALWILQACVGHRDPDTWAYIP